MVPKDWLTILIVQDMMGKRKVKVKARSLITCVIQTRFLSGLHSGV